MEVILKQDYPSLGYVGDKVNVRRGYARNFLIPRGLAVEIGSRNARTLKHLVAGVEAHKAKLKSTAEELAKRLGELKLEFTLKLGAVGKSFGSISLRDVELALEAQGHKLDRRQLKLSEQIKSGGNFNLIVKLHSEVSVNIPIHVSAERAAAPATEEGEEGPRRKRGGKGRGKKAEAGEEAAPEAEASPEQEKSE